MREREHLQRLDQIWQRDPIYFVTACVLGRRKLLAQPAGAEILIRTWIDAPRIHGWSIGRYVVMPDHVHFFEARSAGEKALSDFIRDWKKWTTRELHAAGLAMGAVWQPEYFDHVVRSPKSYEEKWEYVRQNPVRAKLALSADLWPFSGTCCELVVRRNL